MKFDQSLRAADAGASVLFCAYAAAGMERELFNPEVASQGVMYLKDVWYIAAGERLREGDGGTREVNCSNHTGVASHHCLLIRSFLALPFLFAPTFATNESSSSSSSHFHFPSHLS